MNVSGLPFDELDSFLRRVSSLFSLPPPPFARAFATFRDLGSDGRTVDLLDEGLDLALLGLLVFRHAAGDLGGVALDAGDESVGEGVRLGAVVKWRDDHALLARIAAPGDDLEGDCKFFVFSFLRRLCRSESRQVRGSWGFAWVQNGWFNVRQRVRP